MCSDLMFASYPKVFVGIDSLKLMAEPFTFCFQIVMLVTGMSLHFSKYVKVSYTLEVIVL